MIPSFLTLLCFHWLGDFVLQTHWQASNKSKDLVALFGHITVYMAVLAIGAVMVFGAASGPFVAVNGILHLATDYFTSRWSARLWAKQDWHNFFVVIGLDQLIHQLTLGWTMVMFFGGAA